MRDAMGSPAKASGLYKAVVTMLVESSALYAVNSLLFIVSWGIGSPLTSLFFPILAETQVRAVFAFPRRTAIMEYGRLIMAINRSSLRSSSLYESPTGVH
jgi:hypothetical protein